MLLQQLEQVPSAMSGAEASSLSMFNLNNVRRGAHGVWAGGKPGGGRGGGALRCAGDRHGTRARPLCSAASHWLLVTCPPMPRGRAPLTHPHARAPPVPRQVTPGGSLLNTLIGLSRLGSAASGGSRPLRVAMAGCVGGGDRLGAYVRTQLRAAGVAVVKPEPGAAAPAPPAGAATGGVAATGTVMVFCTPDAQRSFLSCIPGGESIDLTPELLVAAQRSRLLVVEGYLFDLPGAADALPALVAAAKAAGTVVALTMGDAGVGAWMRRLGPHQACEAWCMQRAALGMAALAVRMRACHPHV